MSYCCYFQAHIVKEQVWFVTSMLRGDDHIVFDRTVDLQRSIFEFFVPENCVDQFLNIMRLLQQHGVVHGLVELPNRLRVQNADATC